MSGHVHNINVVIPEAGVVVAIEKREAADVVRLGPSPRVLGADDVVDPKTVPITNK